MPIPAVPCAPDGAAVRGGGLRSGEPGVLLGLGGGVGPAGTPSAPPSAPPSPAPLGPAVAPPSAPARPGTRPWRWCPRPGRPGAGVRLLGRGGHVVVVERHVVLRFDRPVPGRPGVLPMMAILAARPRVEADTGAGRRGEALVSVRRTHVRRTEEGSWPGRRDAPSCTSTWTPSSPASRCGGTPSWPGRRSSSAAPATAAWSPRPPTRPAATACTRPCPPPGPCGCARRRRCCRATWRSTPRSPGRSWRCSARSPRWSSR